MSDKQLRRTLDALTGARESLAHKQQTGLIDLRDIDHAVRRLYVAMDEMLRYLLENDETEDE